MTPFRRPFVKTVYYGHRWAAPARAGRHRTSPPSAGACRVFITHAFLLKPPRQTPETCVNWWDTTRASKLSLQR